MQGVVFILCLIIASFHVGNILAEIENNEIYSFDITSEGGKVLSITIDPETKNASLTEQSGTNTKQRFIPRTNSDNTFTLFSEDQPWNWVDHIVESTKFVNIRIVPQVLGVIGGSNNVVEQNYQGTNTNGQKWYIVPTGDDPNTGVITSLLLRQCLTGNGENQPLGISPCNWSDPNQVFTVTGRTTGRFC